MLDATMRKKKLKPDVDDGYVKKEFGKNVRHYRGKLDPDEEGKWTTKRIGLMLGLTGGAAVANWERGEDFPSPARLVKLSVILKRPLDDLLPRGLVRRWQRENKRKGSQPTAAEEKKKAV